MLSALVLGLATWLLSLPTFALDRPSATGVDTGGETKNGGITAWAEGNVSSGSAPTPPSGNGVMRPRCTFSLVEKVDAVTSGEGGLANGGVFRDQATKDPADASGRSTETLYTRQCPGQPSVYVWLASAEAVDIQELISSAYAEVTRKLPKPALNMNPSPESGGVVSLGLWLAVSDPGSVWALAEVGPVWASVTATVVTVEWSMGNGDVVVCDGLGTPISDTTSVEQGPCGYTYEWSSAPQFTGTDDLAYHASVTATWQVQLVTSDGRNEYLDSLTMTQDYSYVVREIQAVGTA